MEKLQENGNYVLAEKTEKNKVELCMEEVQSVLDKYKCEIICRPQSMYGQTVYVPLIAEIKDNK